MSNWQGVQQLSQIDMIRIHTKTKVWEKGKGRVTNISWRPTVQQSLCYALCPWITESSQQYWKVGSIIPILDE